MPRLSLTICAAAVSLLAAAAVPVSAQEDKIGVTGIKFIGVRSVDEARLKGALAMKKSSWLPWGRKRYFNRAQFDADLKRIVAFYADRGFPNARVTTFDIRLNDKQDTVDLVVTVDEGEPVTVKTVKFEGFEAIPEKHLRALQRRALLKEGEPLDRSLLAATREMAVNELKDHGYPYARVEVIEEPNAGAEENVSVEAKAVQVTFAAAPGPIAYVGPIAIQGNASVDDGVIRRQLTFKPGELFRLSELQNSQRRLYGLELFQFANVEILKPEEQLAEVPIRVTVAEGKHRRLNFSVGYGTEERARVESEWHHVNFFGGARTAGVHAKWSSLDRGVRVGFNQPYLFTPHLSLGLDGQNWFLNEPAFRSRNYGGRVTVHHRANPRQSWSVTLLNQYELTTISNEALEDLSLRDELIALGLDPRTGKQEGTLAATAFELQRNTTNNLLNASTGYVASVRVEQAGRLLPGTYNYLALSGEGRHYLSIARRFVLANRMQFGFIDPAANRDANVPFSKRHFLGGSTSLRGWGRFEVGPTSGSGLSLGGFSLFAWTSEIRFPVTGRLGGVFFMDAGNVWRDAWDVKLGDLRYDVGTGLRYMTPIGPIRFDVGYQLTPIEGLLVNGRPQTRRYRLHFSIGQAF